MADYSKDLYDYKYECRRNCSALDDGYQQGRADERKKIMEIVDSADDIAQAMYLLGQYIILEEMKE